MSDVRGVLEASKNVNIAELSITLQYLNYTHSNTFNRHNSSSGFFLFSPGNYIVNWCYEFSFAI